MRVFEKFNGSGETCLICKTKDEKETVLIAIDGTEKDGIEQAKQVHLDCINLRIGVMDSGQRSLIYQIVEK